MTEIILSSDEELVPREEDTAEARQAPRERVPVDNPYPWGNMAQLRILAEGLSDAVQERIRVTNRVEHGAVADFVLGDTMIAMAREIENRYREMLRMQYELQVPENIQEWAETIPGMASGELFPKLLGLLGHPRVAIPYRYEKNEETGKQVLVADGDPFERSLHQLWQYCGCGDPDSRPQKGATRDEVLRAGKLTVIRPVLYTFSTYLVMQHKRQDAVRNSQFYQVYMQARAEAENMRHRKQCQNRKPRHLRPNGCGTQAHPEWGAPGTPLRPGHMSAHAHRMVAKAFLRALFEVSTLD